MSDLIDRQLAIDAIEEYADRLQMVNWEENPNVPYKVYTLNWCVNTIRDLASAQPERKTGRWLFDILETTSGFFYGVRRCSECGMIGGGTRYCPYCGTDMKGGNDETD